jgi:hypothetical protein
VPKVYLGDGVFAQLDRHTNIVLTVEDGIRTTDTIVLEPDVLRALMTYASTVGTRQAQPERVAEIDQTDWPTGGGSSHE